MKIIKSLFFAVLCFPLLANAATYDVFEVIPHHWKILRIAKDSGAFSDQINFSLVNGSSGTVALSFLDMIGGLEDVSVKLYDASNGLLNKFHYDYYEYGNPIEPVSTVHFPLSYYNGANTVYLKFLDKGNYHFIITGKSTLTSPINLYNIAPSFYVGAENNAYGAYKIQISSATPEPETYAMLLLGLGSIGFIRRKKLKLEKF
ncbi:MAG: PEP-CTERM sorting domain-containing protein [Pseudomonadota bacterium]